MSKKILFILLPLLVLAALLVWIWPENEPAGTEEKQKISISMGYIPNVQFTPFYVAMDQGYFSAAGLEVEFDYGTSSDIMQLIGTGEKQFAITDGDQVFLARSQELPIRSILSYYQHNPASIVSLSETAIVSLDDLKDKTIGIPGLYGSSYTALAAFLADQSLDDEEVEISPIGYTQIESLITGRVDAVVVFSNNEPVLLEESGYEFNEIKISDYIGLAGAALVTNETMLSEHPDTVTALVQAMQQAMAYTQQNPQEAFIIAKTQIPELSEDQYQIQSSILTRTMELWQPFDPSQPLGWHDNAIWQQTDSNLVSLSIIPASLPLDQVYTDQYLSKDIL